MIISTAVRGRLPEQYVQKAMEFSANLRGAYIQSKTTHLQNRSKGRLWADISRWAERVMRVPGNYLLIAPLFQEIAESEDEGIEA